MQLSICTAIVQLVLKSLLVCQCFTHSCLDPLIVLFSYLKQYVSHFRIEPLSALIVLKSGSMLIFCYR